jgi:hypothetical protein
MAAEAAAKQIPYLDRQRLLFSFASQRLLIMMKLTLSLSGQGLGGGGYCR